MHRRVLVVTEGRVTERQYVERINQFLRHAGVTVSVVAEGVGRDPLAVVRRSVARRDQAVKDRKSYDDVLCLVDVDDHANLSQAIDLAKAQGIVLLVSRLKFGTWLLWHVDESTATRSSRQLDELMHKHGLLHSGKHLSPTFPVEKVDQAVTTARRADPALASWRTGPDPSSAVPVLVDVMRGTSAG